MVGLTVYVPIHLTNINNKHRSVEIKWKAVVIQPSTGLRELPARRCN